MYKKGEVIGKYLIINGWISKKNKKYKVKCNNCGYIKDVFYNALDRCRHCKPRLRNTIDNGEYISLQLTGGEYTLIDKVNYEKIRNYCWYKTKKNSVEARIGYKLIKLHRFILNPSKDLAIDHINCDYLDNRKINLRTYINYNL